MEWFEDNEPPRRPRRAPTFPVRFTEPGQPVVRVEQIGRKRTWDISPPRKRTGSSPEDGSSKASVVYEGRPSFRSHRLRGRYDRHDESEDEWDWDVKQEAYAFSLPRRSRSPFSPDSTLEGSAEPSIKTETNSELHVGVDGPKLGTTLHVHRSKYTGEGSVGGSQSAELKVIHDQKKGQSPLYRWM